MPISSLIIRTKKEKTDEVAKRLSGFNAATVSEIYKEDIIVITDTKKQSDDKQLWKEIEGISGVVKCDLIYYNFEDEEGANHER